MMNWAPLTPESDETTRQYCWSWVAAAVAFGLFLALLYCGGQAGLL